MFATAESKPESRLLIKPREAARLLSVSEKTLWTMTKRGEIPVTRIGLRSVRYSLPALQEWIRRRQVGGTQAQSSTND